VRYDPEPRYSVVGGSVEVGYEAPAAELAGRAPCVVAIDGPAALEWDGLEKRLRRALGAGPTIDMRGSLLPPEEIRRRTESAELRGDPSFARLYEGALADLFAELPARPDLGDGEVALVLGPGSALVEHDVLWYADLPKRSTLEPVRRGRAGTVGWAAGEAGGERRLLFVDWPLFDRHKQSLVGRIDRFLDASALEAPRSLSGEGLRESLRRLAGGPFRTRPTFLPGPWGGQWLRRELGIEAETPNLAWSYELIAPEAGILLGDEAPLEVGFELLLAEQGAQILGPEVAERFGRSFPIRFDYLDTLEGGHLSIQCHPSERYMRETFGWPYTQHESYYVMATSPGAGIFLGLREDADLSEFHAEAEAAEHSGAELDPRRYLLEHPAEEHRLYLIPAGTPHASGAGNVVLEISATPYLYTLRFYDWLRRDLDGELRPVHVHHAFANVDPARRGEAVWRDLIPEPRTVRAGDGWSELELGNLPELFYVVHRLDFDERVADDTAGRFHVLNLAAGKEVEIETASGRSHRLAYAETIVIPAAAGAYELRRTRGPACKVVKAFVR
jgi:mannose-6-phosphate isomerase class I